MRKKQVIIIESAASDILTKIALGLRKKGYETVFISIIGGIEPQLLKEAYNKIISFDARFLRTNLSSLPSAFFMGIEKSPRIIKVVLELRKLKPYMVIGRTTPNWLYFLTKKYFKDCPVIYYPGDIRSFSYKDIKEATSVGVPKFEIDAERWDFKNADGIIHKGSEDELKHLNRNVLGNIQIKCPDIYFFPYCLEEFMMPLNKKKISSKDKNIHIVYVGHVAAGTSPTTYAWWTGVKTITKQKIYVHFYCKTNNFTKEEEEKRVKLNTKEIFEDPFIKFHEPVSQKELSKEISKYDYGLYSCSSIRDKGYKMATGNKIASYLEAGLPIICSEQFETAAKLLREYGIGVVLESSRFRQLKKILEENKPAKFKKNILKTRKELGMSKHIPRMEKFFKEVSKYYKQKID